MDARWRGMGLEGGVLVAGALVLSALAACGGASAPLPGNVGGPDGGGGADSGATVDGSEGHDGGGASACPILPPASGATCTPDGQPCEYGDDPNVSCDTLARCSGGMWTVETPPPGESCPTSSPGTNGCPATYGGVAIGASCRGTAECAYPQGRCACTVPLGGPVMVGDAGSTWVCEEPGAGCPEPRPLAGTPCTTTNQQTCDYGGCTLPGGTDMQCQNGAWTVMETACAAAAR